MSAAQTLRRRAPGGEILRGGERFVLDALPVASLSGVQSGLRSEGGLLGVLATARTSRRCVN